MIVPEDLVDLLEINETIEYIRERGAKRVALQLPDQWMQYARRIVHALQSATECRAFVLADTSYAPCCVDEINAQHCDADLLVHYGHACLSKTNRLPVKYVFGRSPLEIFKVAQAVTTWKHSQAEDESPIVVCYDVEYAYCQQQLVQALCSSGCIVAHLIPASHDVHGLETEQRHLHYSSGFSFEVPCARSAAERFRFLYIGQRDQVQRDILLNFSDSEMWLYSNEEMAFLPSSIQRKRILMRRYYLMEKVRDASIIGIVVGTLGVDRYLDVIQRLKRLISEAGKTAFVVSVGKLNVPKLANFAEIDLYCLVSCPFAAQLDSSDYFREVVSPFEVELALNPARQWTGGYATDFRSLLTESESVEETIPVDEQVPRYSSITGRLMTDHSKTHSKEDSSHSPDDITLENRVLNIQSQPTLARFLERSFQGLSFNTQSSNDPAQLQPGQTGLPRHYTYLNPSPSRNENP